MKTILFQEYKGSVLGLLTDFYGWDGVSPEGAHPHDFSHNCREYYDDDLSISEAAKCFYDDYRLSGCVFTGEKK